MTSIETALPGGESPARDDEADVPVGLGRRAFAEFLGTALLVTVVVGSGIAAEQLSPHNVGLQLLESSIATAFGLTVLILVFAPVSGAHLNPAVTLVAWRLDRRAASEPGWHTFAAFVPAQCAGALFGAVLANAMFDVPTAWATTDRASSGHLIGEVTATAGLILIIFSLIRTDRSALIAPAVGAYIGAAYWFASSTSFANPAVTVGRMYSDTFAGIAPGSVPPFVLMQASGALVGAIAVLVLYPLRHTKPRKQGI